MGCRPSKQATSKVRAVDDSLCLCSPRKVRKNHKCSGSTSKPMITGSKKHSLSSGHRPRSANGASMDFPAFSTTTAVYRKSASKTSKITLRLSCDGSTLEIEQCDYDLEKACGDLTPKPRPWHSAPNLTKLKDKKTRLFREKPMKHSTSTWSPSVSSTVSGCHGLTMRVPVIINATENQNSNKSLAASHRSSNESQAGSGSSQGRSNTGKTPLLKTAYKQSSDAAQFTYRNFCDLSSDIDRSRLGARMSYRDHDNTKQSLNSRADNSTRVEEVSTHLDDDVQAKNNKPRSHGYKVRDDSESSAEFEQIPVNVITSYGPPLRLEKPYGITDSNHNPVQFCSNACCLQDKRTRLEPTFLAPQFRSLVSKTQQSSMECSQTTNMFAINNFSTHEDMSVYTPRDDSPVNLMSQIDSSSILSFVALGCPVPNDISNFPYSSDDEAPRGFFTPQPGIIDPYDSLDDEGITFGVTNNAHAAIPGVGNLYTRGKDTGSWLESRNSKDKKLLSAGEAMARLKYINGYLDHTRGFSHETTENKKEARREWIDGELRLVKDEDAGVEDSSWASDYWTTAKFPVLKTHVSASSLLCDAAEQKTGEVVNEESGVSCCSQSEIPRVNEPSQYDVADSECQSSESSILTSHLSTDVESVDSELADVEVVLAVEEPADINATPIDSENMDEEPLTLESVTIKSADEASLDEESTTFLMSDNIEPSLSVGSNKEGKISLNISHLKPKTQKDFSIALSGEDTCNMKSQIDIETPIHDHTCFESSETESIDSSQNLFVIHDFQDEDKIDTFKDTTESQRADYLMELLTGELNMKRTPDIKESLYSSEYHNFLENGIYSMTNSSESESGLIRNSILNNKLHNCESIYPSQPLWIKPVNTTSLYLVKINILNQNLSSLDPLNGFSYADVNRLECKKSDSCTFNVGSQKHESQEKYFDWCGESALSDSYINKDTHLPNEADKGRDNLCMVTSTNYVTMNGTYTDVHSFENCKYQKLARERQMGKVNDHLTRATTTGVLQSGGHKQASGVDIFVQDSTGSKVSTSLCPPAPALSQTQSDFEGESVSIQAHGERPPGTHFERHLNEGSIDPSKITHLDLEGKCPTTPTLPFYCNVPRCSPISQESSNRFKKALLCKNGPRDNESIGFNGGHDTRNMDTEAIYIEKDNFFGTSDCQESGDAKRDARISKSKLRPHDSSQSSITSCKGLVSQTGDIRLQNLKQVSSHNKTVKYHYDTEFQKPSSDCNSNGYCKDNSKYYNNDLHYKILDFRNKSPNIMSSSVEEKVSNTELSRCSVSSRNETKPVGLSKATQHYRASSYPLCSNNLHKARTTTSMQAKEDKFFNYSQFRDNQETKRCPAVYISGSKHIGDNSNRTKYANDIGEVPRYQSIRERLKPSINTTSSTATSTLGQVLLDSSSDGHSLSIDSDRRQAHTDLFYGHFAEATNQESIPRNSVLSLVRYFEKVPYLTNNAK